MGDLQATIEFLVELYKFYNVDLFIRGNYQLRFTFKPPKCSHAVQVEVCDTQGEKGPFSLFPAFITEDGQTAASRTFNIYYKDEEILIKDAFLFRVHLLIDSTKAADCIEKTALEMSVDVHFTDQVVKENNYQTLPMVTSRTLKFHLSCFNGLHHQVPLLFDYYYFSVIDLIIHANVVSLGLPNWSILKPAKTGWFSKTTPRTSTSTPMFFNTLFGNRYQLGTQFYSEASLKYALPSSSITRECFEKSSAIHRNLCVILAMAHSKLLNYFDEMMQYVDEKQRIQLAGTKLDPADLVIGLCKKLETLRSCEEVFEEICSDLSVLNNELSLLWTQFQESFALNDKIRLKLREQHHAERMLHFGEAFFVHELPWRSLLNATDSSAQKHASMGQYVKSSRYLSIIPPVTVECAEVDGDTSSIPIFFEDRYVSTKDVSTNAVTIAVSGATLEDEVLEHKPLWLGILNKAFHDSTPSPGDVGGEEHVTGEEECANIKEGNDAIVHVTGDENLKDGITDLVSIMTEVVENSSDDANDNICVGDVEERVDIAQKEPSACQDGSPKEVSICGLQQDNTTDEVVRNCEESTSDDQRQNESSVCQEDKTSDVGSQQPKTGSNEGLKEILEPDDSGVRTGNGILALNEEGEPWSEEEDTNEWRFEDIIARVSEVLNCDGARQDDGAVDDRGEGVGELGSTKPTEDTRPDKDLVATSGDSGESVSGTLRTSVNVEAGESDVPTAHSGSVSLEVSVDPGVLGNGTDSCEETTGGRDTPLVGMASCEEEHEGGGEAVSGGDVKVFPEIVEEGGVGGQDHEIETQEKVSFSADTTQEKVSFSADTTKEKVSFSADTTRETVSFSADTKADTLVETRCAECGGKKTTQDSETERTSESKMPHGDDSQGTTAGCSTLKRRVSNSVFYERTSEQARNSDVISKERQLSEPFLDFSSLQNDNIALVRLSSSSSADTASCFCGGKLGRTSSPYRTDSEIATTNLKLQQAKQEVKARINYCGALYSDLDSEFLVRAYFLEPKPDLSSEPVHFVVCVHGLDGNSGDLRLLRCFLEMTLPSTRFEFLMSEINQDNTFLPFEQLTEKLVSEILHHMEAYRVVPSRISFIGHSLGNIVIRSALTHPLMEPYVELFHTFLSLSGPHLGMIYHTSSLVSTGLWLMQKWKKSASLLQLSLNDSTDMRETFLYKLSKKKGLEYFTNVLLVSSVQDHYVPFHSARIEMPKMPGRSNSQESSVYREMMENMLTPLLSKSNRTLVRYSVYHCLPSSTNSFIGRAAHIAMLDSELFIEKLICRSAVRYFQ